MASSSGAQQLIYQQRFKCKECGLTLNSAESLKVHSQYHEGNLMQQWAQKAIEEKNNNMTKREFSSSNGRMIEVCDNQKKSPDYHRGASPEGVYGQPPTPQSYQSATSSPYEYNDSSNKISPNFQSYSIVKSERNSPSNYVPNFQNFSEQQFFPADSTGQFLPELHANKMRSATISRYDPYNRYYGPTKSEGVPQISPTYAPQPTPSPSPKQCDKCGYVCQTAEQLIEHNTITHQGQQYNQNHYVFEPQTIKEEDASQSDILDLDSHKVVHPEWSNEKPDDKQANVVSATHSVTALLNPWPSQSTLQQSNMFQSEQIHYINSNEGKLFANLSDSQFSANHQNFANNPVSSSNPDLDSVTQQSYRAYEHMPATSNSVITSTQVPQVPNSTSAPPATGTKSANWKSNEARRPKTYNCTACNKWFTSSGHLKRHYNTTLHKNAVKSSGQPDPASLPISAHHHPSRDSANSKDERQNSNSPREESRGSDSNGMGVGQYGGAMMQHSPNGSMGGLIQQSPNGPYGHNTPMHSPIGQHHPGLANSGHMIQNPNPFSSLASGGSPNGDAGLSPQDARGLLSPPTHNFNLMPTQPHMISMEGPQFQIYPNGVAPHVTQVTDSINNIRITGDETHQYIQQENQPLPSFEELQTRARFGGFANVGGMVSVTTPAALNTYQINTGTNLDLNDPSRTIFLREDDGNFKLAVLDGSGLIIEQPNATEINQYSPTNLNNNNNNTSFNQLDNATQLNYISAAQLTEMAPAPMQMEQIPSNENSSSEAKENEVAEGSQGDVSVTSAAANDPDLSKTKCFDCDKVFNRPCYLTQHNKTCHGGDKPYKCQRCGKRFGDEVVFEQHTRRHAGVKPHKCDMCPKMFNHKTDLRRHTSGHTGRKPYACSICGKGFIRKDHMVKHTETHLRKRERLGAMRS